MHIQKIAKVFGIVLLAVGILGFVGPLVPSGNLLGIFEVDALHNIIHILSGILALVMASDAAKAKLYFKIFGVVYAIVTLVGFLQGDSVLGLIGVNLADNLLHLVISIAALSLGFGGSKSSSMPMSNN